MSEWPCDPQHDWPPHFRAGDFVRDTDPTIAPEPPPEPEPGVPANGQIFTAS